MEWTKHRLCEIADIDISGVDKKTYEDEIPVRLCNFTDVYHNWAITESLANSFMHASANKKEFDKFSLKKGQVAFTKDSETRDDIGIPTYIADDFNNVLLGYHCALVTPHKNKINGKFLNAFLHSEYIHKYFELNATGSGMRFTLSQKTLEDIPILLPPFKYQEEIGEIFATIDKKIAITREINRNLDAIAKQLYDYWFVQFDFPDANGRPYKSSGGKMVWNEILKREIPERWEVKDINKWLEIKSGYPFKSEDYKESGLYKIVTIKNVQDRDLDTNSCDFISDVPKDIPDYVRLKEGDRLISLTGNCGRLCIVTEHNLLLNQRVGLLQCEDQYVEYAYFFFLSEEMQKKCGYLANGAAQANLSPIDICKIKSLVPSSQTLDTFNQIMRNIRIDFIEKFKEIQKLLRLRDELLPLLMNGQVSIRQLNSDLSVY